MFGVLELKCIETLPSTLLSHAFFFLPPSSFLSLTLSFSRSHCELTLSFITSRTLSLLAVCRSLSWPLSFFYLYMCVSLSSSSLSGSVLLCVCLPPTSFCFTRKFLHLYFCSITDMWSQQTIATWSKEDEHWFFNEVTHHRWCPTWILCAAEFECFSSFTNMASFSKVLAAYIDEVQCS